jgi:hypothetical protein
MLLSRGDPTVFVDPVSKPISFSFLVAAALLLAVIAAPAIRRKREEAFAEEGDAQHAAAEAAPGEEAAAARDTGGRLVKWSVYRNAEGNVIPVREGFNWAAFLFGGLWALMKDLFVATMAWFAAVLVLFVASWWISRDAKIYLYGMLPLALVFGAYYGRRGNAWLCRKLEAHGYKLVRQIEAPNAALAAARGRRLAAAAA